MRAVVQRVKRAKVTVRGEIAAEIGAGLLILLGVAMTDGDTDADALADKIINLRVFGVDGKMDLSLIDKRGGILVVSQFTLYGDTRRGRRPSFINAAPAEQAKLLYERFIARCRMSGLEVVTGVFRAMMDVESINDGPVTLILDTDQI